MKQGLKVMFSISLCWLSFGCEPLEDQAPPPEKTAQAPKTPAPPPMSPEDKVLWDEAKTHFSPLKPPAVKAVDRIDLGRMLYHEPRLSKSGVISCNTCHNLASYGVDNRVTALGHGLKASTRNVPTTLNAHLNFKQFWDGRADNLVAQVKQTLMDPQKMAGSSEAALIQRLETIPEYITAFKKAFPSHEKPLTVQTLAEALAAFESTLVTPAPFDDFLKGQGDAISEDAKKGLKQFIELGCVQCHQGPGLGGDQFKKFGEVKPYVHQKDTGRETVTKEESDKYLFKVPSLRNIERTYPYFHDGKISDLKEAVKIMSQTQLGKDITDEDAKAIVAFLNTLTGSLSSQARTLPLLPPANEAGQ